MKNAPEKNRANFSSFTPIARLDLHHRKITIIPTSTPADPAPDIEPYPLLSSNFQGSAHNIVSIYGHEQQNGNIALLFLYLDRITRTTESLQNCSLFWVTGSATDQATCGNGEGQEG